MRLTCSGLAAVLALSCAWLPAAEPLKLVTGNGYLPYTDNGLPEGGIFTAIVQRSLAVAGYTSTVDWLPWARGYKDTLDGRYAATFPYVQTPERAAQYLFSEPVVQMTTYLYGRADGQEITLKPGVLKDKVLCLPAGFVALPSVYKLMGGGTPRVETPADMSACASMVALGRADFFVTNSLLGDLVLRKLPSGYPKLAASAQPLDTRALYFIAPRKQPGSASLIAAFNKGLAQLHTDKTWDMLINQYVTTLLNSHSATAALQNRGGRAQ
ncbi:polar amino acid transport system substrate-binding protein [Silvimonas terrae]|uniref:Polar amino acid transport system substrate-binding protein n=1 Tax=Silvimonas terrae TaxID=300266 RepID=A0A840RAJ3_9NEIS|nr:transporter substrate-binding domain-containing protein [Silvimonas terrae]MBB5189372.1 polar amino acid transport system substrate-binding protein [Silvimonas terrae]